MDIKDYNDKELKCIDCPQSFTLSTGEQKFFDSKGYVYPKRCVPCRKKKTTEMNAKRQNDEKSTLSNETNKETTN